MRSTRCSIDLWSEWGGASRLWSSGSQILLTALGILLLGGCGDITKPEVFEPETSPEALYNSLTLDHRAINLSLVAPYDTIQLTATPRNMLGEPLSGLPEPTFRSSDTVAVWVTPDGLVQARSAAAGVQVIAEVVTADNIRHADTAFVSVTASPSVPELASLSISFASPEEARASMYAFGIDIVNIFTMASGIPSLQAITADALDTNGTPLFGLEIEYLSLDPANVRIDRRTGMIERVEGPPGEVAVVARTTAYGVVRVDTAVIMVTGPIGQGIMITTSSRGELSVEPREIIIRPGGYVLWWNQAEGRTLGITFDDPAAALASPEMCLVLSSMIPSLCDSGNVPPFAASTLIFEGIRVRQFIDPGVYEYQITDSDFRGVVRVVEDDDPMWDTLRSKE